MPRGEGKGKGEKGKGQGKGKGKGKFPGGAAAGGAMMPPPPAPARAAPGGAGKGGKRYPSPGAATGGAGKGRVTGVGELPHERVHWKGDRELEAYYDDIRRHWMEDITENFPKFDPAWTDPQGYKPLTFPFVVAHVGPPGGMRYRIADLHDAADLGPTVPQLDPFEEGNIGLSRRLSWLLRHGAPEKGASLGHGRVGGHSPCGSNLPHPARDPNRDRSGVRQGTLPGRGYGTPCNRDGERPTPSSGASRGTPCASLMNGG